RSRGTCPASTRTCPATTSISSRGGRGRTRVAFRSHSGTKNEEKGTRSDASARLARQGRDVHLIRSHEQDAFGSARRVAAQRDRSGRCGRRHSDARGGRGTGGRGRGGGAHGRAGVALVEASDRERNSLLGPTRAMGDLHWVGRGRDRNGRR